ncbi:MAG: quercetin dioxygenase-like cupin family protein [Candidatus Poriferisodalaceae bacterium]|jgi:beta-alanine degradation protein BauB
MSNELASDSTPRQPATSEQQLDNGVVRVTKWTFAPGTETGSHVHEFDYVVVPVTTGTLTIESAQGATPSPIVLGRSYNRSAGVEHNVVNLTDAEVAFVEIELLEHNISS